MSELKVNSIKGVGASAAAITVNNTDGTCTANITNNLSNRNLIINGAMQVAQRGTSSTTSGYGSVDRWQGQHANTGVTVTHSQQTTSSSDAPYQSGFGKFLRLALSGAGTANANAYLELQYRTESQDMLNSGWNYKSSSSSITMSFWFRCSTNQTFLARVFNHDSLRGYDFSFTASGNNAWTKITKTIAGNSNLVFNDDNGIGLRIHITPFYGTDYTNNLALDQWITGDPNNQFPDMASTWLTAGASTFDITGVQLEVGSVATDFEHRSIAHELQLCKRYYEVLVSGSGKTWGGIASMYRANETHHQCNWVEKRATPSLEFTTGNNYYAFYGNVTNVTANRPTQLLYAHTKAGGIQTDSSYLSGNLLQGGAAFSYSNNAAAYVAVSAEL